jgi:hypothetical protein
VPYDVLVPCDVVVPWLCGVVVPCDEVVASQLVASELEVDCFLHIVAQHLILAQRLL